MTTIFRNGEFAEISDARFAPTFIGSQRGGFEQQSLMTRRATRAARRANRSV